MYAPQASHCTPQIYTTLHTNTYCLSHVSNDGRREGAGGLDEGQGWRREEQDSRVAAHSADTGKPSRDSGAGNHATVSMAGLRHQVQKDNQWATV